MKNFSGFLVREGFDNVNQLEGGIVEYGKDKDARGENYDGECYVFDQRIKVPVNRVNATTVSHCIHCREECLRYVNCAYAPCNEQHFCCEKCEEISLGFCCEECREKDEIAKQNSPKQESNL